MSTPIPDQGTRPDFASAVRGYDRAQVDAYVAHVLEWLADAQRRSELAERERDELAREVAELRAAAVALEDRAGGPVPESLHAFSGRIGDLMQRAMEAAHDLETQAEAEARDLHDAANAEARLLVDEARAEAERIVGHARDSERVVEEHVADLKAARAEVLAGLDALREMLTEIMARPEPGTEAGAGDGVPASDGRRGGEPGDAEGTSGDAGAAPGDHGGVAGTAAPTLVQPAAAPVGPPEGSGPADGSAPAGGGASDEPTIVQPAVTEAGARTEEQPVIRKRR